MIWGIFSLFFVYSKKKEGVGMREKIYNAKDIAKYILSYCTREGNPASNLKLQKLLYFVWIDFFKQTKRRLFENEICAWQYGPVVPDVYYEYCKYASSNLVLDENINIISHYDANIIDDVLQDYIDLSAFDLVNRSHAAELPWATIYQNGVGNRKNIPFSLIEESTTNV